VAPARSIIAPDGNQTGDVITAVATNRRYDACAPAQDSRNHSRKRFGKIPARVSLGLHSHGQTCCPGPFVGDSDHGYQGEHWGGSVVLRGLLPIVPMVQATQARDGNHD
jgi:hypothetical protein